MGLRVVMMVMVRAASRCEGCKKREKVEKRGLIKLKVSTCYAKKMESFVSLNGFKRFAENKVFIDLENNFLIEVSQSGFKTSKGKLIKLSRTFAM